MFDYLEIFRKNYYRNKGQRLLLKGKPTKAFPYLEKALLMDNSPHNLYNLALNFIAMQRNDEAEKYLISTVLETPDNALAVITLSDLYMQKREWHKAEPLLEKLSDTYPNNKVYRKYYERVSDPQLRENYVRAKELLNETRNHIYKKEFDQALKCLLQAEEHDPQSSYVHSNLGSFYLRVKKDPRKAFEYYNNAYQLNPNNKAFKHNLELTRKLVAKGK